MQADETRAVPRGQDGLVRVSRTFHVTPGAFHRGEPKQLSQRLPSVREHGWTDGHRGYPQNITDAFCSKLIMETEASAEARVDPPEPGRQRRHAPRSLSPSTSRSTKPSAPLHVFRAESGQDSRRLRRQDNGHKAGKGRTARIEQRRRPLESARSEVRRPRLPTNRRET